MRLFAVHSKVLLLNSGVLLKMALFFFSLFNDLGNFEQRKWWQKKMQRKQKKIFLQNCYFWEMLYTFPQEFFFNHSNFKIIGWYLDH